MNRNFTSGLVSVIIATFNQAKYIDETLRSIVQQTYSNLEIIVSDDCSTDNTLEKLYQWAAEDKRIIVLPSPENRGYSHNMNKALAIATGEFTAVIDGDDIALPDKIEKQVSFLNQNKDYDAVVHWVDVFDDKTGETISHFNSHILTNPRDWFTGQKWNFTKKKLNSAFPPTAYLARSTYALHAKWDERLRYKNEILYAIDNYMNKPQAKWACLPEVLGKYRIHDSNMHRSKEMGEVLMEETYINYGIAVSRYPELTEDLRSVLTHFLFAHLSHQAIYNKNVCPKLLKKIRQRFYIEAGLPLYLYGILLISLERLRNRLAEARS